MAYGDKKQKRTRQYSWTKADQASHDADQRRRERQVQQADQQRQDFLSSLTPGERARVLEQEEADRMKRDKTRRDRQEEYSRQLKLQRENLVADSRLISGQLQSEIATAVAYKEKYGQSDGEWLDDPVAAITGQGGFGEEVAKSVGIKLQIHLCLDCSNSMRYNNLTQVSVAVMRTLYLALEHAATQLAGDSLKTHMWLWARGADGKEVEHISDPDRYWFQKDEDDPRGSTALLPSDSGSRGWTGEDTWIYPLLERLDQWENNHGDPGAYRLDIIISDGMLEHATDARKGDGIQDRRDGNLQSIVLNFLPMEDWADYRVPNRCVQYPATSDNLQALLMAILGDWLISL